ncbi:glycosyltransferase family 39 protein [Streptomyces sp. NPDC096057]|uniref:glycosyltransferase family 39 protein n=1 Tax=Streptomyces sp. NPDC096057 TaxID=3155543 RepID=UPI003332A2D5
MDSQDEDESKRRFRWTRTESVAVAVPVAVMLALGLWGLDRGGMWGDEGVTFMVGRRTVPQIWRLLHGVDAVHGLYYLLMHAVLTVHPGEVVLRLPSLCGAAATAGLVAALGTRLARPRVGLWAGLLYATTPLTGHYAQEGRSYALVAAGVAAATLLLVRALEGRSWWPYGAVLAVTFLLHEFAVLVLCAHAVTLAAARVRGAVWRGWIAAVGIAGGVLIPLVWVSERQSAQVAWLRVPDWDTTERLARDFLAVTPTGIVFWTSVVLILIGLGAGRLTSVALPLLLLPPVILLSVSQFRPLFHERYVLYALAGAPLLVAAGADRLAGAVRRLWLEERGVPGGRHTEDERAVSEVGGRRELVGAVSGGGAGAGAGAGGDRTSGVEAGGGIAGATGAGLGADRVTAAAAAAPARAGSPPPLHNVHAVPTPPTTRPTGPVHGSLRRPHRPDRTLRPHLLTLAGVLAVSLPFLHGLPAYRNDRSADRRPENLAAVAALVGREVRPGEPVLFLPSFWRVTASAYPGPFAGARDLALGESGARSGTLSGREVGPGELRARLAGVDRVWIVAQSNLLPSRWVPGDPTDRVKLDVVDGEFARRQEYVHGRVKLALYIRRMPPQDTPGLVGPPMSAATPAPPPPRPAPR